MSSNYKEHWENACVQISELEGSLSAIQKLILKAEKQLREILASQLMKEAEHFVPRVRDRWEGQLSVVLEVKKALGLVGEEQ